MIYWTVLAIFPTQLAHIRLQPISADNWWWQPLKPKLYLQERRAEIVSLVNERGRVSVAELSQRFGLSRTTIRADLDAIMQQGLLSRTHGGAISSANNSAEMSFDVGRRLHETAKSIIGAAAAAMIRDGDAIALDASTTALSVAHHLKGFHELTVITNGIHIALSLLHTPGVTVLLPGGFLRPDSVSLIGHDGYELIQKYNFQKGFFGAKGLTLEEGLTDVNRDEVTVKEAMISRTKQVIAIVDSSKWGRVGLASFAAIEQLDCVITDPDAPEEMVSALRQAGIDVVIG